MVFDIGLWSLVVGFWLVVLTVWVVYREFLFRRFFKGVREKDIRSLLENLLKNVAEGSVAIKEIDGALQLVKKRDLRHIQKVGLVKFNPFRDAGGNQSFALALLNEENSGVLLTGLHARETTRIYIKEVVDGQGKSEMSKEEKEAIAVAVGKGNPSASLRASK